MNADLTLSVKNLTVTYKAARGLVRAVRDVSFDLHRGECIALIGESGSGKTTLGLSLVRLHVRAANIAAGSLIYHPKQGAPYDVLKLSHENLRRFRWKECAMVFQGAQNAMNPLLTIGTQFLDTASDHDWTNARDVEQRGMELLRLVQLDPKRVWSSYPHQLSGGMRQRVLIALGLLLQPQILILDEPTTALDILTQRAIIDVLRDLRKQLDFSMILVSHDLSLAAELADRVATMYAGKLVETAKVDDAFYRPHHPYTLGLVKSVPTISAKIEDLRSIGGSPPDLIQLPPGCKFHPRCAFANERCRQTEPLVEVVGDLHEVMCHEWRNVFNPVTA